MTKLEGHNFMTNYFGHWLFDQSTSDPTWPILRGKIMTKLEGHGSESAQSTVVRSSPTIQPIQVFFLAPLYRPAQHFSPNNYLTVNLDDESRPVCSPFYSIFEK